MSSCQCTVCIFRGICFARLYRVRGREDGEERTDFVVIFGSGVVDGLPFSVLHAKEIRVYINYNNTYFGLHAV